MRSQRPQHSVPPCQKSIELLCEIQCGVKMGKRIQYTGTTEEKQPSCAFRTDFGTKRYVYPLSFALLSRFPKGTAEPSQSRLTACQLPRGGNFISAYRQMRKSSPFGGAGAVAPEGVGVPLGKVAATNGSRRKGLPQTKIPPSFKMTGGKRCF